MNRHSGNQLPGTEQSKSGIIGQQRSRGSYGTNGGVPIPNGSGYSPEGRDRNDNTPNGPQALDVARSPPNLPNKNTKHVPCKFFRQGACQAGNACPFLHTLDPMSQQAPCKYFMKGNCKFGAKCALAHYLPNGHRVNKSELDPALAMNRAMHGGPNKMDSSPLGNPDHEQNRLSQAFSDTFPNQDMQFPLEDESDAYNDRYNQYRSSNNMGSGLNSPPTSHFGSPINDNQFPKSPVDNLRSALNAPLPASFDANSLPRIARYGPYGQSVPDKFGLRSPANNPLSQKMGSPPTRDPVVRSANLGSNLKNSSPMGLSPNNPDDYLGQRVTPTSRTLAHSRAISASVPDRDWDESEMNMESDLLPSGLHDEVLTPQEKMRRLSRPDQELSSSARDWSDGLAIPKRGSGALASSPMSGSPSRFRAIFEEQQREKNPPMASPNNFGSGHIGSPLRETWMSNEPFGPAARGGPQIAGLSQAMGRMELNRTESGESFGSRPISSGLRGSLGRFDRTISSPGLSSKRTDEENEPAFFPMDGDNDPKSDRVVGNQIGTRLGRYV